MPVTIAPPAPRRPPAPRKTSRQRLSNLVAYWLLKLLIGQGFWKQLPGYPKALTFDGDLLRTLGLGRHEDEDLTPNAFQRLLKERLRVLSAQQPEAILAPVHERLQSELALSLVEARILSFVLALLSQRPFASVAEEFGELSPQDVIAALATALDLSRPVVRKALAADGHLARSGLLRLNSGGVETLADSFLALDGLEALLFDQRTSVDRLTRAYFAPAPRPTLKLRDYPHLSETLGDLLAYLKAASQAAEPGCNVLLHGPPGVGKTELAGVVAQRLKRRLYAISAVDEDGDPIGDARRVAAYQLAQHRLSRQPDSLILFDEAESLLAPSWLDALFSEDAPTTNRGFVNQLLETNPLPTLWIANRIADTDPAFVRRFDLLIEVPVPPLSVRAGIATKAMQDLDVSATFTQTLARQANLAPAHLTRAARVARLCAAGGASRVETEAQLTRLLNGTLKALGHDTPLRTASSELTRYRLDLLNPDRPIEPILRGLALGGQGRLCLYGPPGTGKSALAAEIARRLDRPLLVKRASDLLGSLVGQTEQAINAMFAEARHDQAVLLLDEADSFLRSRASAHQSWEVTQVNELLTQMEAFAGVFICTTNLVEQLDAASLRRFDLKVKFAALTAEQRLRLFTQVLTEQGIPAPDQSLWRAQLGSLDDLTPGDFAAVIRQLRIEQAEWSAARLFERLQAECRHKRQGRGRPIGFAAAL